MCARCVWCAVASALGFKGARKQHRTNHEVPEQLPLKTQDQNRDMINHQVYDAAVQDVRLQVSGVYQKACFYTNLSLAFSTALPR